MTKTEKPKVSRKRVKPLVKSEFKELAKVDRNYDSAQLEFIRKTLAPSLNNDELRLFIYRAQKLGLNPLNGEISAHSRDTKHGRKMVVIIGKDGKARKAMQTGLVEWATVEAIYTRPRSKKVGTIRVEPWEGGTLWGARAEVKRGNVEKPFEVVLPVDEYSTGELTKYLPSTMIKKTALSQAYTMAFPDLFAGVYVEEELPTILNEPNTPALLKDGTRPATDEQVATIKALGGLSRITENTTGDNKLTKQEAADYIKELAQKKGKK